MGKTARGKNNMIDFIALDCCLCAIDCILIYFVGYYWGEI